MIELDIKIRANNENNLKRLLEIMTDSFRVSNAARNVDITLSATMDSDNTIKVIRKEITNI